MPAAKAVLRDIADNGLDPCIAYKRCSHDGRLVMPSVQTSSTSVLVQPIQEHVVDVMTSEKQDATEHVKLDEVEVPVIEEKKQSMKDAERGQSPVSLPDTKKAPKPKRQ